MVWVDSPTEHYTGFTWRPGQTGEGAWEYLGLSTVVHVVDDEPSVRKAVSRLLRAAGYDVAIYESAEQLLDRLPEKSESGCILLDVLMPGVSGPAMREQLERIGSTLPILFMTGSVEPIQGDPEAFLKKPVAKEELLDAVERALGSVRASE